MKLERTGVAKISCLEDQILKQKNPCKKLYHFFAKVVSTFKTYFFEDTFV